jgi:hypothetical protein
MGSMYSGLQTTSGSIVNDSLQVMIKTACKENNFTDGNQEREVNIT